MKYLILLIFSPLTIFSQNLGGLVWDDVKYKTIERIADFDGSHFSESVFKVDLKPYCPIPNNQGSIGSCVGQAVGYGAMTIMHAKKNNITDKRRITKDAFSALYIFNQIKLDCKIGSRYNDAFELLKHKGDVKFKDFDINEAENCYKLPNEIDHKKAKQNKIESYAKLFEIGESSDIKIIQTRAILASGNPVLVGMEVTDDIYKVNRDDTFWRLTTNSIKKGGHAMVVVGYDDTKKAFELLNSWGEKWGNDGYCWISYDDYAKQCKYAYHIKLKEHTTIQKISGELELMSIVPQEQNVLHVAQKTIFRENYYSISGKKWGVGSQFQLKVRNIENGGYVYVFSIDASKNSFVHFPRKETLNSHFLALNETPNIPSRKAEIIIPNKETALVKEKLGDDYLFILVSSKLIDDSELLNHIDEVKNGQSDFINNFYNSFYGKIITSRYIKYKKSKMSVEGIAADGFIAPIILKIE